MKSDSVQFERQRRRTGTSCSHASKIVPRRAVGLEGLVHLISVLTSEYLLPSQWVLVLATTHLLPLRSEYLFTLRRNSRNLSDMWRSTFKIGAAQLRSVKEFAPKSPFLRMKRGSIRYSFIVFVRASYPVQCKHNLNMRIFSRLLSWRCRRRRRFRYLSSLM